MKISIIIPTLNQSISIERTILSYTEQDYLEKELIVVDGGSSDGTIEILKKHQNDITICISEKDNGQANALNKGFALATGDIFAYINSDDCYDSGAFKTILGP